MTTTLSIGERLAMIPEASSGLLATMGYQPSTVAI